LQKNKNGVSMIADILDKIVDKLIKLTQMRETRIRRYFFEHIESIYSDMEKVHSDYLNTFSRISDLISSATKDDTYWFKVLNEVRRAALPFQNVRDKVRITVAYILRSDEDFKTDEAGQFFIACAYYFNVSLFQLADHNPSTAYFKLERIVKESVYYPINSNDSEMAKQAIIDLQDELRLAWNRISQSYAKAREKYLK
jgi:hypothetical protein